MRFPLRLSADLLKARASGLFGGTSARPAIVHIVPTGDCIERAKSVGAPVVWLAGQEPLLSPEIGRVANALVDLGRHVFIHADGGYLRQRIHAFRPDSRLFLTLEFFGGEKTQDRLNAQSDSFARSVEAIRAAKLSGFLVAAHIAVTPETDVCEIGDLIEVLDKKDVDGFIVSTKGVISASNNAALADTLSETRALIRCGRWENFSRLLEESYAVAAPASTQGKLSANTENVFEESD